MDNYIGEIKAFPYNFVPEYWFACNGQQLQIIQYQALFAVIGHFYDPTNNPNPQQYFYLPNLQGVVPVGATATGINSVYVGQTGGTEAVTLNLGQIPAHNHKIQAEIFSHAGNLAQLAAQPGPQVYLTNATYTISSATTKAINVFTYANTLGKQQVTLNATTLSVVGSSAAHENRMPFLPLQFGICWNGIFPIHQS